MPTTAVANCGYAAAFRIAIFAHPSVGLSAPSDYRTSPAIRRASLETTSTAGAFPIPALNRTSGRYRAAAMRLATVSGGALTDGRRKVI